ncbi:hypothetical protein L13192_11534 [Pyrenophora tritici-repentis]|uniref:Uncharacterized protein n=2 Tax=Pyrenophora tritici-repentis TaxID=45151 RepID=A0A922NI15_9PLEO|nr:uncharacterized protein PTRG_07757 [Pyrenophora tritici-repentis Pt-1C-BFP]EDU50676.1 predicted protein [Pyrenophora tritici-repentis Pt-1C-BFP]KAI1515467.1 hypothetical protein Ptr86124_005468 [Pyrenophora tritici-repentis]KAI1664350.1 hypothetical protein L13192_11534 [Pyrenophora tritici-repentis]KAI1678451.1 hypothetical protein KJE20_12059 [Pyrenophora tritici-repentis]
MAEVEDPGYESSDDLGEETSGDIGLSTPKLQAFSNLGEFEVWVPQTNMDADSEDDEDEDDGLGEEERASYTTASNFEESTENFTRTMRDKNPRVKVTYRRFPDKRAMKKCWFDHS